MKDALAEIATADPTTAWVRTRFVWNNEIAAVAAAHSVDPRRWQTAFTAVLDTLEPRFTRYEPLRHAAALMSGMLAPLERKNCWTIAEHRGELLRTGCSICWRAPGGMPTRSATTRLRGRRLRRPARGDRRGRDR